MANSIQTSLNINDNRIIQILSKTFFFKKNNHQSAIKTLISQVPTKASITKKVKKVCSSSKDDEKSSPIIDIDNLLMKHARTTKSLQIMMMEAEMMRLVQKSFRGKKVRIH